MIPIVYFDLETGGVEMHHPIIQLAALAVDFESGIEIARFNRRLTFKVEECDPEALRINQYSPEKWVDAQPSHVVVMEFQDFLNKRRWVPQVSKRTGKSFSVAKCGGYNSEGFDMPRLKRFFADHGMFLPAHMRTLDVLQLADWYFHIYPEQRPADTKLLTVCQHFGLDFKESEAHDAMNDVIYTAALAHGLKELMRKEVPIGLVGSIAHAPA